MEVVNRPMFTIGILLLLVNISVVVRARSLLHFGFVTPDGFTAEEFSPPLEIALTRINNHSHVLAGHRLVSASWQTNNVSLICISYRPSIKL